MFYVDPDLAPLVPLSRQGQNRFEAVAEAQEDFNEMVQEARFVSAALGKPWEKHRKTIPYAPDMKYLLRNLGHLWGECW